MPQEYELIFHQKTQIAQNTWQFGFSSNTMINYKAGQHADFILPIPSHDSKGDIRAFSLVRSPNQNKITIATRIFEKPKRSGFKQNLLDLENETIIKMSRPMGNFILHQNATKPAIFLIGGIGITPVHSIIEFATEEKLSHSIYLFYSNHSPETAPFLDNLNKFSKDNSNFKLFPIYTGLDKVSEGSIKGPINESLIKNYLEKDTIYNSFYYLSGPPQMVEAMQAILESMQIDLDNIKTEEFSGY